MKNKIEKIDVSTARKYSQEKKYGVIGDNCMGVWGDGDTVEEAIQSAVEYIRSEFSGQLTKFIDDENGGHEVEKTDSEILSECWVMELE